MGKLSMQGHAITKNALCTVHSPQSNTVPPTSCAENPLSSEHHAFKQTHDRPAEARATALRSSQHVFPDRSGYCAATPRTCRTGASPPSAVASAVQEGHHHIELAALRLSPAAVYTLMDAQSLLWLSLLIVLTLLHLFDLIDALQRQPRLSRQTTGYLC